jgi:hypothetical protein
VKLSDLQPGTEFRVRLRDGSKSLKFRLVEHQPSGALLVFVGTAADGKFAEITSNPDVEVVSP